MSKYKLVVFTTPAEGREDEYNNWYENIHIPEVLAIKGFKSAKRLMLKQPMGEHKTYPYLALYDIENDGLEEVLADMAAKRDSMTLSDAVTEDTYLAIYEEK